MLDRKLQSFYFKIVTVQKVAKVVYSLAVRYTEGEV